MKDLALGGGALKARSRTRRLAATGGAQQRKSKLILQASQTTWATPRFRSRVWRIGLMIFLFRGLVSANESTIIANPDLAALSSGIQAGGLVTLAFDGTIKLNESFTISEDTTLDAAGHIVTLDGGSLVRHFVVRNGAKLRLVNLTMANGWFKGRDGQADAPAGGDARG